MTLNTYLRRWEIFTIVSLNPVKVHKPEFEQMMNPLRTGDTMVVWKL